MNTSIRIRNHFVSHAAATLLLARAYVSYGPTMTSSFDHAAAERRIEARLPLVLEVEAHLLKRDQVDPVFTLQSGDAESPRANEDA